MDEGITTNEFASLYALDAVSHDERPRIERWLDLAGSVRRDGFLREVVAVRSTMDVLAVLTAVILHRDCVGGCLRGCRGIGIHVGTAAKVHNQHTKTFRKRSVRW